MADLTKTSLYDSDLVLWAEQQARALRELGQRSNEAVGSDGIDWENVAEEIESLGRSDRRAIVSHLTIIIEHVMKLRISSASEPRAGWKETILRARNDVEMLLDESPSLRPEIPSMAAKAAASARRHVRDALDLYGVQPIRPIDEVVPSVDQVLGPWLPDEGS